MNTNNQEFLSIMDDDEQIIITKKPERIPFLLQATPLLLIGVVWFVIVGIMMPFSFDDFFMEFDSSISNPFIMIFSLVRFMPLIIGVVQIIYYFLVYNNTHYAITSKRVILKSGVFGIDYKTIDYDQIKNMEVNVGPIEKLFSVGTIRIFTGEIITNNQQTRSITTDLTAITHPYDVFKQLKKISLDIKTDWNYPNQYRPTDNQGYSTKYKQ